MDATDFLTGEKDRSVGPKPWMAEKTLSLVTKWGSIGKPDGPDLPEAWEGSTDTITQAASAEWEMLEQVVDACIESGHYALDLETTGLDTRVFNGETRDKIVGVCLSPDGERGYYIPVRHKEGVEHNVPMSKVRAAMLRLVSSDAVAIFHNAKFDQEFLQFNGGVPWGEWDSPKTWEDTIILAYLRDSRARVKGLKFLSGKELGMEMIEIHELYGHEKTKRGFNYDFSALDPSAPEVTWYAAADAICTYKLWEILHPQVVAPKDQGRNQKGIYAIERACLTATRWMERCRVHTDQEKVRSLIGLGQRELVDSLKEVYEAANKALGRDITPTYFYLALQEIQKNNPTLEIGDDSIPLMQLLEESRKRASNPLIVAKYEGLGDKADRLPLTDKKGRTWPAEYDVMSAKQLGVLLDEVGVPGLVRTEKSKQVKTSKDALDKALDKGGNKFPWLTKIKRFREVQKALSTYLIPLWEDADPTDDTVRINFNGFKVDTGRFSAPSSRNPGLDGGTRFPMHGTPSTYDPTRPQCLSRIRECVTPRSGRFLVAIDYAGEELRIATNISGEPRWLTEFFRCSGCDMQFETGDGTDTPDPPPPFCPRCGSDKIGDLHTMTGIAVYGEAAPDRPDWKALRGNAKATNFALSYGGGGSAVQRSVGVDKNEGWRIKRSFDQNYQGLVSWWGRQHAFARKHGFVKTAFGRVYPLPDIYHEDGGFRSKAERNAVNGPIQGAGADIIKIAMALIYKHVKKKQWFDKIDLIACMHDELVFEIDASIIEEAIADIEQIMTRNPVILSKRWAVPLTTDVEVGRDWTVPWNLTKMLHGKKEWEPSLAPHFQGGVDPKAPDDPKAVKPDTQLPQNPPGQNIDNAGNTSSADYGQEGLQGSEDSTHLSMERTRSVSHQESEATSAGGSKPDSVPEGPTEESLPEIPFQAEPTIRVANEVYTYRVTKLSLDTMLTLAEVIVKSRHRGTTKLILVDSNGDPLDWHSETVFINETVFHVLAKEYGLGL